MDYFYLKLGQGNHLAADWLEGRNPLGRAAAPIFFDNLTAKDYSNGKGGNEPREFVRRGEASLREKTLMVVLHAGEALVLQPAGSVEFLPSAENSEGEWLTTKAMPVEIITRRAMKEVPPVLAGLSANQFYTRGTFRPLNDWGNFKAVDWVVGRVGKSDHWKLEDNGPDQLIECLGSTELETLVAKLLEDCRFFVPAYRGGVMKDIDLFGHNDTKQPIGIGSLTVPPGRSISVQVKRWAKGMECPDGVDLLVGIGVTGPNTIDAEMLISLVNQSVAVRGWLHRSLHWLPEEFRRCFGEH